MPTPSRVPARTRTAAVSKKAASTPFHAVTEIDADGNYDALIFGEKFTLSTDVNGWLLFLAGSGSSRHVVNLVESLIVVPDGEGDIEVRRAAEAARFHETLGRQKGFKVEHAVELVNALTEASAGNEE